MDTCMWWTNGCYKHIWGSQDYDGHMYLMDTSMWWTYVMDSCMWSTHVMNACVYMWWTYMC